jgi:hypothetical protein
MNRREILKAMAVLPLTNALAGCRESRPSPAPEPSRNARVHTLQILFEGAFALVLRKGNPSRLIAFVPRADHANPTLAHDFFFNDPLTARPASKGQEGYQFQLAGEGLRPYTETYVNPGFADFEASTEKWRLPERAVTVELPFPNSVNFSGRPLHVRFVSGKTGLMPTNHLLEYYVEDPEKIRLMCSQLEGKCPPSPNCPPGIVRYFFGVSPQNKGDGQKHAVEFFNFMLRTSFPDLEKRYELSYIEASEENTHPGSGATAPGVKPAVYDSSTPSARLLETSAVLDCQSGGLLVHTDAGPTG